MSDFESAMHGKADVQRYAARMVAMKRSSS